MATRNVSGCTCEICQGEKAPGKPIDRRVLSNGVYCCEEVSLCCNPGREISGEWTCCKCPPWLGLAGHYGDNTPCPPQWRPESGVPCVPRLPALRCACFPPVQRGSILPDIDHDSSVPLTFVRLPALARYTHLLCQALPSSPIFGQAKSCPKLLLARLV